MPAADRRDEIVAAAVRLLGRPEAFSLRQVATEAGASRALVYHYFGDRETLHVAAVRAVAGELLARLAPSERPPLEQLRHSVGQYVAFADEHAEGFLAILRGAPHGEADEVRRVVETVRRRVLDLVTHTLGLDLPSPMLRMSCAAWVSFAERLTLDWLAGRELGRDDVEDLLARHLLATLTVAAETDAALSAALDNAMTADVPSSAT
ncbi:MAG TPA: TetR/AcrR family transcriptional regulator [Streptosporangiales bacterium]